MSVTILSPLAQWIRIPAVHIILGTDNIGRDYFSRLIYAGRISLTVALLSVIISETIGIFVGAISGFYGGWAGRCFDALC